MGGSQTFSVQSLYGLNFSGCPHFSGLKSFGIKSKNFRGPKFSGVTIVAGSNLLRTTFVGFTFIKIFVWFKNFGGLSLWKFLFLGGQLFWKSLFFRIKFWGAQKISGVNIFQGAQIFGVQYFWGTQLFGEQNIFSYFWGRQFWCSKCLGSNVWGLRFVSCQIFLFFAVFYKVYFVFKIVQLVRFWNRTSGSWNTRPPSAVVFKFPLSSFLPQARTSTCKLYNLVAPLQAAVIRYKLPFWLYMWRGFIDTLAWQVWDDIFMYCFSKMLFSSPDH